MKKVLLIGTFVMCILNTTLNAQTLSYNWSKSIGSSGQETINSIVPTNDNKLYEGGTFEGTVNFNPSGTAVTKSSLGLKNGFISQRQNDGTYIRTLFLLGLGTIQVNNLHVDENNDLYVVGTYTQDLSFDNGTTQSSLPTVSVETGFILKVNDAGNLVWSGSLLTQASSSVSAIKTTSSNELIVVGKYADSTDFDLNAGTNFLVSNPTFSTAYTDGFYAKYSSNGDLISVTSFGNEYPEGIVDVAIDQNDNLLLTGFYRGSIDCDPSVSNAFLPFSNMDGIFLVKYSSSGSLVFSGGYPQASGSDHIARKVLFDSEGNAFICGDIAENIDLDFGPATYSVTGFSGRYVFYAKYSPTGTFLWGNSFGNSSTQTGNAMALDASNHLYIVGSFFANMSIDDSFGNVSPTLVNSGNSDIFMVRYNADGELLWTESFGGTQGDQARTIAISNDNLFVGGYFSNTINLDPLGIANNHVSGGSFDAFSVKYQGICSDNLLNVVASDLEVCAGESVSITASGMDQISFDNGVLNGQAFVPLTSTSYTIIGENTSGAGCIISKTIQIQVNSVNVSTSVSGQTITATETAASYQWVDCSNGFSTISGQTAQSFTPTQTGNYAVIVTKNGCSDTSACTNITISSNFINENENEFIVEVYPNPTNGSFEIKSDVDLLNELYIYSVSGKVLYQKDMIFAKKISLNEGLPTGIYYLKISCLNGTSKSLKLIVQ